MFRHRHSNRIFRAAALALLIALVTSTSARAADDVIAWNAHAFNVLAASGPVFSIVPTRFMAMVHAAIHDALNVIERRYQPYAFTADGPPSASPEAAVAAAAHGVLVSVIPGFGTPAQEAAGIAAVNAIYAASLAAIPEGPDKIDGIAIGEAAAAHIVALRADDGAREANIPYAPLPGAGFWQPTPNPIPPDPAAGGPGLLPAVLPGWGNVHPFALRRAEQFRPHGPWALRSRKYAADYHELKSVGDKSSATRTADQSHAARFWFEPSLNGWNRIARTVAAPCVRDLWHQARLFALLNFAMADGFIAGWNTKYFYNFWRPVTAIRAGDMDDNPDTVVDLAWESFLNTPAHPDYPSTHSVLGAAAAEVLARFFGTDHVAFTMTSGAPFAGLTRSYSSFSQAAQENADSRVYAGIHFRKACRDGVRLGRRIGAFTSRRVLEPIVR